MHVYNKAKKLFRIKTNTLRKEKKNQKILTNKYKNNNLN